MKKYYDKKTVISIVLAGFWIAFSEFLRNEIVLKAFWAKHYQDLGLTFTTTPLNGVAWFLWSIILAGVIYVLLQKFTFLRTAFLAWVTGFVLMWMTIFNLQVLPILILIFAIPWSLIEVFVACWIIKKTSR